MNRLVLGLVLAGAQCATNGCGVFESSTSEASFKSSSESSSSFCKSSSGDDEKSSAYERDVRDVTARYVGTDAAADGLDRDLGTIAERHGIVDWEADERTYRGIGQGLARAGVAGRSLDSLATRLAHDDAQRLCWIRAGHDAVVVR